MKTIRRPSTSLARAAAGAAHVGVANVGELKELGVRLAEAEEALHAIRTGEADAVVTAGKNGIQVFTLESAGHEYRTLIESMNEGALTLALDKMILYANQCFARMVKCPLEQVTGSFFRRFLSAADRTTLRRSMKTAGPSGAKLQVLLKADDDSRLPVQLSIRRMAGNGFKRATFGLVVTDLTEARRTEELLRALTHRAVQVQEAERGRVAQELHDHITQLLCAVLFRSQALAASLSARDGPAKAEATTLRVMLGETVEEVERISRDLRPSVLEYMGLAVVLRDASKEFAGRTGVPVKVHCVELSPRLPADTELVLYRIFQEALKNVEEHAHARRVTVGLKRQGDSVVLTISDNGIGFDADHHAARLKAKRVLGLLDMDERAAHVGGVLTVKSGPRAGTIIEVRVPGR